MARLAQTLSATLARGDARARRGRAALHVLDWLGNAALGTGTATGQAFGRWLALQGAGDVPTLFGRHADPAAAAAAHGALGSLYEMDDVHRSAILHTGPVVVPAALAAAAIPGAQTTGAAVLDAVVAGVEAMVRVGRTLGTSHYRFWHNTGTAGCFGAAATAAQVLGLDEVATAHALALAGTRGGGLWQVRHEAGQGKAWHMAGAARAGLDAAMLAACGLTGPLAVIEGPSGWLAATAPQGDAAALDEPRDEPWLWDLSFKPWPACRHAHPAMDALSTMLADHRLQAADVGLVEVHTYADALRFCNRVHPATEAQARFSIQHALAAWLLWGEPELAHYRESALTGDAVSALRERIVLHDDAAISARFPARYGARVELQLRDGRRLRHELHDTLGDPARPMSAAQVEAKARRSMHEAGWRGARIDAAVAACTGLPTATSLAALDAVIFGAQR
jgi:2-methylcitrate dehydratase PrpD